MKQLKITMELTMGITDDWEEEFQDEHDGQASTSAEELQAFIVDRIVNDRFTGDLVQRYNMTHTVVELPDA